MTRVGTGGGSGVAAVDCGPFRPLLDPPRQHGDLGVVELAPGRHLGVAIVADDLDQPARAGIARLEDRPRFATAHHRGTRVEPQPGFLLRRSMTVIAVALEDRADLLLEERALLGVGFRFLAPCRAIGEGKRPAGNGNDDQRQGPAHRASPSGMGLKGEPILTQAGREANRAGLRQRVEHHLSLKSAVGQGSDQSATRFPESGTVVMKPFRSLPAPLILPGKH